MADRQSVAYTIANACLSVTIMGFLTSVTLVFSQTLDQPELLPYGFAAMAGVMNLVRMSASVRDFLFICEIEGSEEQKWLARLFVESAFLDKSGADIQVVETFDSCGEEHARRKAVCLIGGKRK